MALCQLFIQPEAAYNIVSELGEIGAVQFSDVGRKKPHSNIIESLICKSNVQLTPNVNALQRKFVNEVRRSDEMGRKIRYIRSEVQKAGIAMADVYDIHARAPNPREFINIDAILEKTEMTFWNFPRTMCN